MVVSVAFDSSPKFGSSITAIKPGAARRKLRTGVAGLAAVTLFGVTAPTSVLAAERDAVRDWNAHAIAALINANTAATPGAQFSPPVGIIHLAIVQGAVYDAVNAIKGGHDPYLDSRVVAPTNASKGAAAATAAHHVLIALIDQAPTTANLTVGVKNTIKARLDASYATSLADIPAGQGKAQGIKVGAEAAAAMLLDRAGDGRFGAPGFPVPAEPGPGQWRPLSDLPSANDPNGWVRSVRPFMLPSSEHFHTPGPLPLASVQYANEFNEVKALGRATESTRTVEQTSLAHWSAGHPVPMFFAAMRQVSVSKDLTISQDARFLAMTSMTTADTIINCFAEKAHWSFWRPTTAIRLADTDGNSGTDPDVAWSSLLPVPPYGDEPSGANCFTSAMMNSAKAFFGSDAAEFDLTSPGVGMGTGSTRHYTSFSAVIPDMVEARILGGLHFRRPDVNGAALGKQVADFVDANFFNCGPPGQCKKELLE